MTYTLPERNAIIARIEDAQKYVNMTVRTGLIVMSTEELEDLAIKLEHSVGVLKP